MAIHGANTPSDTVTVGTKRVVYHCVICGMYRYFLVRKTQRNMRFIFSTAATINGYLASTDNSLQWLFEVAGPQPDNQSLLENVGVMVMGSTTYEWIIRHERLLTEPEKWQTFFGTKTTFVFSSKNQPIPDGADVRVVSGNVSLHLNSIRSAAKNADVWIQGGGDLAGQFLDAGSLDVIEVSMAPVFLHEGQALFPRDLFSNRLVLREARKVGQFVVARYDVLKN